MTTKVASPQMQFGNGAPVANAPQGTIYFDTSATPYVGYVFDNGAWISFAASGGGGTVIQKATVNLTANQLNHLFSAPVILVPAPGAGKMLLWIGGLCDYTFVSADGVAPGAGATLNYGGPTGPKADNSFGVYDTPFAGFGASTFEVAFTQDTQINSVIGETPFSNQALFLTTSADASVPTDGSAAMTAYYFVLTL